MKVFVTGATGYIGIQLVKRLAGMGLEVHALYRSESKADLIRMKGVQPFKGDILDMDSLVTAMKGCSQAYHVAAFAGVWSKDPQLIYRLNVEGTLFVIKAAKKCGIKRLVITSTAGILGPSEKDPVHENSPPPSSFFTPYEESKYIMEQELMKLDETDPEIVVVNPTRVYGPGFMSESNGLTKMILKYMEGNWRFIPGDGESMGNYVYVEDVVSGYLLAMENGKHGERYILGGENITYNQLFRYIAETSDVHKRLLRIPLWLMLTIAVFARASARILNRPPLIVPDLIRKYNHNWIVSSEKSMRELGYAPVSVRTGIEKTVNWLRIQYK